MGGVLGRFCRSFFLQDRPFLFQKNQQVLDQKQPKKSKFGNKLETKAVKNSSAENFSVKSDSPEKKMLKEIPQTPKDLIRRILAEVENVEPDKIDFAKVAGFLDLLREFGEDSSKAIQDFLRTRKDVLFEGEGISVGRQDGLPSIRAAFLEVLYDMKNPASLSASLEVLKSTSVGFEVVLAARNLEKFSPGTYRSEALKAVKELLPKMADVQPEDDVMFNWNTRILEIIGHYHATEMIPEVEQLLKKHPELADTWMNSSFQLPAQDQVASLKRLMADPEIQSTVTGNIWQLNQLDFRDSSARQLVQDIFDYKMTPEIQEEFLSQANHASEDWQYNLSMKPYDGRQVSLTAASIASEKGRIEGMLNLLNTLEPRLANDSLRQRLNDSRETLRQQLNQLEESLKEMTKTPES